MNCALFGRLAVFLGLIGAAAATAQSPTIAPAEYAVTQQRTRLFGPTRPRLAPVPLDILPASFREPIAKIVRDPTLAAHGSAEEFPAGPYDWLLEHPDRVATAWRRLGIPCVAILPKGDGRFTWVDADGSNVSWVTAYRGQDMHIWYADGQAKPATTLPLIPVRAVAVLRHAHRADESGQILVKHEVDVYLQTDSKAAALVSRLIGPAAPRMAEQGATQLLLFFSSLAKYLDERPDQVPTLLRR
ncbi:MAG TPA: hypothetical protein VH120_14605 [Gemmataceae bacterium]|nr:hypothetical protein [Gemmataceae bacterium]